MTGKITCLHKAQPMREVRRLLAVTAAERETAWDAPLAGSAARSRAGACNAPQGSHGAATGGVAPGHETEAQREAALAEHEARDAMERSRRKPLQTIGEIIERTKT